MLDKAQWSTVKVRAAVSLVYHKPKMYVSGASRAISGSHSMYSCRVNRVFSAYTDDYMFSVDLVGAVRFLIDPGVGILTGSNNRLFDKGHL